MIKNNKLLINENHIIEILLEEFNKNVVGVKYLYSDWGKVGEFDSQGDFKGNLIIQRRAFDNNRFDVIETFDETTYAIDEIEIVPIHFGNLNAEFLSHPLITQVNFSPDISVLVNADDPVKVKANQTALEEMRARFIQYSKNVKISNFNLDYDVTNQEYLTKNYKMVVTAGEIDYGDIETINGINYMVMSISINVFVTDKGFLSNQQKFIFGVDTIVDSNGYPKMFEMPLITWHWGTVVETNSIQLLNQKLNSGINKLRSAEVISNPQSKGFALTFYIEPDLHDEFQLFLYKQSFKRENKIPKYYIEFKTYIYDEVLEDYKELMDLNDKRTYILESVSPPSELALGDVVGLSLTFTPSEEVEWFK